ncbi:MAG TPA: diacylglycerol kinase family protein [Solirubrobacteraceae bacterium]|jgi:YegS/Rv2252/BmrU family lipid kinase|nr:diacylglycerol kinase family protein [Solirubrobacteraceae bacterium]
MDRAVALIVNPQAGGGRAAEALPVVEAALSRLGLRFHTERTRSLEHAEELARGAVAAGETLAALSGDGLIGKLAGELAGTDGVLAVLPGGRGNDLARALGVPQDPEAASEVLATGRIRELDLGEVDGRPYIGIASCGFDSDANRVANEAPPALGNLVYAYGAVRALAAWKPARFELTLDGRGLAFHGDNVAVANSPRYGGGMQIARDAELDDGLFDVVMTGRIPKRRFPMLIAKAFDGSYVDHPSIHVERAREVRIAADRPFSMYADGDPIGDLPVTVRVRPRAVRVLVPA